MGVGRVAAQGPVLRHERTVEALRSESVRGLGPPGPCHGSTHATTGGGLLATAVTLLPLGWVGPASGSDTVRVGAELRPCHVVADALCGSSRDRGSPATRRPAGSRSGSRSGRRPTPAADPGARWSRTRAALATAPPVPASSYAAMYGPLLERRNLLLVDQRGTGGPSRSTARSCRTSRSPTPTRPPLRCPARRAGRRLHDRTLGRRPGRGDRGPGAR